MSKIRSNRCVMSALAEASNIMREIAWTEYGQRALNKVKMKLPEWTYRHVKAVFYQEPRTCVDADEMKALKRAAKIAAEDQEASNEIRELRERLQRLESLLLQADSEFHSPSIEAMRLQTNRLGRSTGE